MNALTLDAPAAFLSGMPQNEEKVEQALKLKKLLDLYAIVMSHDSQKLPMALAQNEKLESAISLLCEDLAHKLTR